MLHLYVYYFVFFILRKFKLINNLDANEFNNAVGGIASNCVYNQILNLKLKKYLKLMNGFEPNIEFSLKLEQYNDASGKFFDIPYTKDNILNADLFLDISVNKSSKIGCEKKYALSSRGTPI